MFFNLTWRNAKRSRSENLIYFLTMITAVAMFYIVLSLGQQDVIRFLSEIESDAVERLLTNLLPTVYLCALLFVFFLVVFANKYQLECRSRELGLYLMFGMTKIKLFIQIMTEGLITSFLALLGGLVCGGFLSEAISLTTARLVGHGIITHQLSFSVSAAIFTSLGFLIIQFVALFVLCGKLFRKELHQLVYGEMAKKQRTGNPYVSFVSFAIGTVILLVAYWIVVEHFMAASGAMLLIAVLLGIIGTILFIRGLARILSIWAASIKHKATRGLYVFTLRQLHENVVNKYISISVASILMMLTIMLITDGSVRIMSYGSELTRGTSVYDFTVMGNDQIVEKYLSNEQIRPYVSNLNRMEIGNIKSTASDGISSPVDWSKFRKQIVQHLPQDVVDPATQEDGMYSFGSDQPAALNLLGLIDTGSSSPYLLPVSSYNRLLDAAGEKQISLGNNEVVYYLNPDFLGNAQDETVTLLNQIAADAQANNEALLSINERPFYLVPSVPMKGLTADENIKIITALIVSDEIYSEFVNSDTCMVYWNFCIPNELVETKGLMLPIMEARDLLKPSGLYYESYLNNFGRQLFYVISGSYTTLYMGFMFLIIACALLALQFLTQMQTTKSRYLTLSILGARREQIKRSINQQVLWYFLLPLILACISGAVGIYAMQLYLYSGAAHLEQSYPLLIAMAVIVVLVMVIYGVAVARTANREIGKLNYKPNNRLINIMGKEADILAKIVVVEDDVYMREELLNLLEKSGYDTIGLSDFENAVSEIAAYFPDLILLDINLPFRSGFEICKELKAKQIGTVLVLTARDKLQDELHALDLGADDYLTKPCNMSRLLARIKNLLRRKEEQVQQGLLDGGGFLLDPNTFTIYVGNSSYLMPPNEGKILLALLKNSPKIVSKKELCIRLWGTEEFIDENALQVNFTRLRKTLREFGLEERIETVRGQGYRLKEQVRL